MRNACVSALIVGAIGTVSWAEGFGLPEQRIRLGVAQPVEVPRAFGIDAPRPVTLEPGTLVTGALVAQDEDSLTLRTDAGRLRVPRASINRLDLSRGRGSHASWALVGAGAGVAIVWAASPRGAECAPGCGPNGFSLAYGVLAGGAAGALAGPLVPAGEHWDRLHVSDGPRRSSSSGPALPIVPAERVRIVLARRVPLSPEATPQRGRERYLEAGMTVTASVMAGDDEALTVQLDRTLDTLRIEPRDVARLEVGRGRQARGRRALIGMGTAVAIAAVLAASEPEWIPVVAGMYAIPGGVVGWLLPPGERWERVGPRTHRPQIALAPQRRGVGLALAVRF